MNTPNRRHLLLGPVLAIGAVAVALAADAPQPSATGAAVSDAIAVLAPTQGQSVSGTVRFHREGEAVHVTGQIIAVDSGQHLNWRTPDIIATTR